MKDAKLRDVLFGLLLSGNIFFANKTIERMDRIEEIARKATQDIAVIQAVQDTQIKKRGD